MRLPHDSALRQQSLGFTAVDIAFATTDLSSDPPNDVYARLHDIGVRRVIGPVGEKGVHRIALSYYKLVVTWLQPDLVYLRSVVSAIASLKRADSMTLVVPVSEDEGAALRALTADNPKVPFDDLLDALQANRPADLVDPDIENDAELSHVLVSARVRKIIEYETWIYCFSDVLAAHSEQALEAMKSLVPAKPYILLPPRSGTTPAALVGSVTKIMDIGRARKVKIVLEGSAFKEGESMPAQMWHIAQAIAGTANLAVFVLGKLTPIIPNVVSVKPSDAPFPTGYQANVILRQGWPPALEKPPIRYCGPGCRVAIILPWEFGTLPNRWMSQLNENIDEIWAPSEYNRRAFIDSGIDPARTYTVPPGIDCGALETVERKTRKLSNIITFFYSGGFLPRKGVDVLLKGWWRAFCTSHEYVARVKLVIHTSYELGFTEREKLQMMKMGKACRNVDWIRGKWFERDEYLKLMATADVYVAPFRSEGFGLPIVEAMQLGIPVITTVGGTAADDYMSNVFGYPINAKPTACDRAPCKDANICIFPPCTAQDCSCDQLVRPPEYSEPNEVQLVQQLIALARSLTSKKKVADVGDKVRAAKNYVGSLYCWENQRHRYIKRIEDVAASSGIRAFGMTRFMILLQGSGGTAQTAPLRSGGPDVEYLERGPFKAAITNDGKLALYGAGGNVMFATHAVATCPCQLEVIQCGFHLLDKSGTVHHTIHEEHCRADLGTALHWLFQRTAISSCTKGRVQTSVQCSGCAASVGPPSSANSQPDHPGSKA